jgi:futalosine hydrolase
MNILIVSATHTEISPLLNFLQNNSKKSNDTQYFLNDHAVTIAVSGLGAIHSSTSVFLAAKSMPYDLAVNAGICGSFSNLVPKGTVLCVFKDRFADIGIQNSDGKFEDIFELQLADPDISPYQNGWLYADLLPEITAPYPSATGITVNTTTGTKSSIECLSDKYHPDIESMEGAGFLYASKLSKIPALQIRSVSNFVEPRNREAWDIPLAIENLNLELIRILKNITVEYTPTIIEN